MTHDDGDADCTLVISPEDLTKIMNGQLDATMAFMTGKLIRSKELLYLPRHGRAVMFCWRVYWQG